MYVTKDSLQIITYTDFTDANRRITQARSTDYGVTWESGDVRISDASSQGSCPAIGPDTMVYVVWGQPASWVPRELWFNRSFDRGVNSGAPMMIDSIGFSSHLNGWRANHTFPAMAVDTTGKLYVGSAYGDSGVWGRWREYARSGHGGNLHLRRLVQRDPAYPGAFLLIYRNRKAKTCEGISPSTIYIGKNWKKFQFKDKLNVRRIF